MERITNTCCSLFARNLFGSSEPDAGEACQPWELMDEFIRHRNRFITERGRSLIDFSDEGEAWDFFVKWRVEYNASRAGDLKSDEKSEEVAPTTTKNVAPTNSVESYDNTVNDPRQHAANFNSLMQFVGSSKSKFKIDTYEETEGIIRILLARSSLQLNGTELEAIYKLMFTNTEIALINMAILATTSTVSEASQASAGIWTDSWNVSGSGIKTFKELAKWFEVVFLPVMRPTASDQHPILTRIKTAANFIVAAITSAAFLSPENNTSSIANSKHLVEIFRHLLIEPLKTALASPSNMRDLMKEIADAIVQSEKRKNDGSAKNFMNFLRKAGTSVSAFKSIMSFQTALIQYAKSLRDAILALSDALPALQSEDVYKILVKLQDPILRAEFLGKSSAPRGPKPVALQRPKAEHAPKGHAGGMTRLQQHDKNGLQPKGNKPNQPTSSEKSTCNGCGTFTDKHGENASSCPYVTQNHPNANKEVKQNWITSAAGIAAKAKGVDRLMWQKTIDDIDFPMTANYKRGGTSNPKRANTAPVSHAPQQGESHNLTHIINNLNVLEGTKPHLHESITTTIPTKTINPFLTTRIINLPNRDGLQKAKTIKTVLVDTGAIDSNYISSKLVRGLEKSYGVVRVPDVREVKTPDRSAPKFYTEGSVDIEIEIHNEVENKIDVIKIKALIIDSPIDLIIGLPTIRENNILVKCMNQILWGTREKWVADKQVTPAQFKIADATLLNSIVDAILIDATSQSGELTEKVIVSTERETSTNCIACHTLVTDEECKRLAEERQHRRRSTGGVNSPCPDRKTYPPQCCPYPTDSQEALNWKPFDIIPRKCLNLCFLCSNAETRHLDRLKNESDEFFNNTMDASEVLDDTRQMLYQLSAKLNTTIEQTQRDLSEKDYGTWRGTSSGETEITMEQTPMEVDEDPQESASHHNRWSGLASALTSKGYPTTRETQPPPVVHPLRAVQPGERISMKDLLKSDETPESDFVWINDPLNDPIYATKEWIEKSEEWRECAVHGSEPLQREIRTLLQKYKSVFSSRLPIEPARVIPLAFHIDESKWKLPCNREPPRRQSLTKDAAIRDMIRDMIQTGVVSTSKADAWSQVLLTAKPNGKWRFCIDYRQLNMLIENRGWPLPRIQELITRVGNAKPKIFGKMDLTNGYHQMPLAKESRKFTAFRSANGLHESNRVPMGLKNAGAYFQQAMADEVIGEILYDGTELYIDDILVHGQTEKEFLTRLEIILKRCMEKGIVLSPKKCAFGMAETEILGHTINDKGSTFSKEKLQGVLDFKLPTTTVQLQSFLGLVNYFRDHVKNVAELERPLRNMLKAYRGKSTQLHWSESDKTAFSVLKNAVWSCPRLYFWQPHLPVFLHTDACNTGIGAYLFQVDENDKELPIGFLSRALKGAELNWSTFEQEGFAIHQALKKFEYLLRDVKFTLRTDHRNLLYMNMKASDKVLRWKLDIQQFDFDVEHIPGPDNIVADLYSRLCSVQTSDYDTNTVEDEQFEEIRKQIEPNRPSAMLAAMHNRFKPAPATRIERPLDAKVYTWLTKCHGHDTLHGHRGVEATLSLLKAKVPPAEYWKGMRKDVRAFVKQCPCCQFMQSSKTLIAQTAPYNVSVRAPMDRVNIDTIGPLPPDVHGNTYIIVLVDVFSRFVELYAAPDATALSAAKAVVQWIGRYGNPGEILTDNGTQYTADVISQLCDLIRVDHLTILPYSHEENAIVERANREVNRHLRAIVFDKKVKNEWSLFLPLVQRIMNASVSASTGVTPASIIFGNSIDLDKGLLPDAAKRAAEHEEGKPLNEYLFKLLKTQAHIIALAQTSQYQANQEHMRRKANLGNQVTGYDVNDYVIYEHPTSLLTGDSRPDKLAMHYRGPYRITNIDGSRITIQNLVNTQLTVAHISQLRPFLYDPIYVNPVDIARNTGEEFEVESIVALRGKRDRIKHYLRTDLEVKVHWLGYSDRYDTWEPFSEMKLNETFQHYCWDNNLRYLLIPEATKRLSAQAR
jgi:transposase InsO family protein